MSGGGVLFGETVQVEQTAAAVVYAHTQCRGGRKDVYENRMDRLTLCMWCRDGMVQKVKPLFAVYKRTHTLLKHAHARAHKSKQIPSYYPDHLTLIRDLQAPETVVTIFFPRFGVS